MRCLRRIISGLAFGVCRSQRCHKVDVREVLVRVLLSLVEAAIEFGKAKFKNVAVASNDALALDQKGRFHGPGQTLDSFFHASSLTDRFCKRNGPLVLCFTGGNK